MNFSYISSSSQKSSGFESTPSQSFDMNYLRNMSSKKLKVEHSQNGILKSDFESVKLSGSIPYTVAKPKDPQSLGGLKGHSYNLQSLMPENNIHGKRIHPELAALAIEDFKRAKSLSMVPTHQVPPVMNNELYEMMRLLNAPVPEMPNYNFNYGKLPLQLPQNNRLPLQYPPSALQGFEQQLNYYNQMAQLLQQQQQQQQQRKNLLFGDLNMAPRSLVIPSIQSHEASNLMNTTCLIEDVASQKKSLKIDLEHLEKRHKISSVTEVRLEDLSSENKTFTFASSKFNVTINKKNEQDNLEEKVKVSPIKEDKAGATSGLNRKQTISNNFQGINLSTSLVTPVHQRIPILY